MLRDLLAEGLDLVVCGSAAGRRSAQLKQYYAGPGNKFWRTLARVGLTPRQFSPAEYRHLLEFGIGLTDLVKQQSGGDHEIDFRLAGRRELERKLARHRPRFLCFNGKRAAREFLGRREIEYGLQTEVVANTRLFVAPSTSGAANAAWDPRHWQTLAELVRASEARSEPQASEAHEACRSSKRLGPRTRKESISSRPSPQRSSPPSAGTSASSATRASSRARAAPRQKCSPKPKPR